MEKFIQYFFNHICPNFFQIHHYLPTPPPTTCSLHLLSQLSPVCAGQLHLGVEPTLEHDQHSRDHTTREKWHCFYQQLSSDSFFLVNGGTTCSLPTPNDGFAQILFRPSQVLWIHMCIYLNCVQETLFLWSHSTLLALTIFLFPLLQRSLSLEGRSVTYMHHLGMRIPNSLTLCVLTTQRVVCVNCCLLQVETLLTIGLWL